MEREVEIKRLDVGYRINIDNYSIEIFKIAGMITIEISDVTERYEILDDVIEKRLLDAVYSDRILLINHIDDNINVVKSLLENVIDFVPDDDIKFVISNILKIVKCCKEPYLIIGYHRICDC